MGNRSRRNGESDEYWDDKYFVVLTRQALRWRFSHGFDAHLAEASPDRQYLAQQGFHPDCGLSVEAAEQWPLTVFPMMAMPNAEKELREHEEQMTAYNRRDMSPNEAKRYTITQREKLKRALELIGPLRPVVNSETLGRPPGKNPTRIEIQEHIRKQLGKRSRETVRLLQKAEHLEWLRKMCEDFYGRLPDDNTVKAAFDAVKTRKKLGKKCRLGNNH